MKRLEPGDILLEASGGSPEKPVGRTAIFNERSSTRHVCSNFFRTLRPNRSVVDPSFLSWRLHHLYRSPTIWGLQQQTTGIINLKFQDYLSIDICMPSLPQQRLIAEILDALDKSILTTERLVAKLNRMKQGLLHDLLTRGIDENGGLRDPEQYPEHFKDSPLGMIPKMWSVLPLGDVVPHVAYGVSVPLGFHSTGIPVLRMNNLKDGETDVSDLKYSASATTRRLLLRPGDVLFNRTNSIEHVGRTGIWRGQLELASFASYLVRLDPEPARLNNEFLNRWLNWPCTQMRIRRYATPGVHQVNINPTNLRKTMIALPSSISEQVAIVEALVAHEATVAAEVRELTKLRLLKQGLMDDLLTGRVRVTPLLAESTP
ncbi:restriction endonuclease subunit S [Sorangium cellulosum]|nr:restriction endonuclease subunit S [Sorangium cellulosum]